jgi:hypothetical protein
MLTIKSIRRYFSIFTFLVVGLGGALNAMAAPNGQTAVFAGGCFWGVETVLFFL